LNLSFLAIGDPSINQVTLLGNDQVLVKEPIQVSTPNGTVVITINHLQNWTPPSFSVDPNCNGMAPGLLQTQSGTGSCVDVTLNGPMIGTARVCYPVPSNLQSAEYVLRCSPGSPCSGADINFTSGSTSWCCTRLTQVFDGNTVCGDTDHFSTVQVGVPTDTDNDFVPDVIDNCRTVSNRNQADQDSDRVGDVCDNCPSVYNPDQKDSNHNGIGDACEAATVPIPTSALALLSGFLLMGGVAMIRRRVLAS
jgi:hypothetical protein